MTWSALALVGTLAVVLIGCLVGIVVAIRVIVRAVRMRNTLPANLDRAGVPSGTDDPKTAFDRASGAQSWTRISGGF